MNFQIFVESVEPGLSESVELGDAYGRFEEFLGKKETVDFQNRGPQYHYDKSDKTNCIGSRPLIDEEGACCGAV
jgi:hypothetical protein